MRALSVFHGDALVGTLRLEDDGHLAFAYASSWLDSASAFPISLRIPLTDGVFTKEADSFFPNLLPEGNVRALVARRLGLSVENDFDLLAAIGGECAGALSLLPEGTAPASGKPRYREVTPEELIVLADQGGVLSSLDAESRMRLSLAGAQDKVPVRLDGDRILIPIGSAPSTHILKFESSTFRHLPANEAFVMSLARAVGIETPTTELRRVGRRRFYVVERFDRRLEGNDVVRRHQEDLCQALALPPSRKYEKEGGPSFADCYALVTGASRRPLVDGLALLRWCAFNAIALNADGHAKNLSLVHGEGASVLSPAYDLICTRAYPSLERKLAMSIGGEADPTLLLRRHWEALARATGTRVTFVVELVHAMAEAIAEALRVTQQEFKDRYGDSPALQLIVPHVRKQARRILKQLAA